MRPAQTSSARPVFSSLCRPTGVNERDEDWTGVNLDALENPIIGAPFDPATSSLLPNPDSVVLQEPVDHPGGPIRFAAVKDCPRPVNMALGAGASSIAGGMGGFVAGFVATEVAHLAGDSATAVLGGTVVAGAVLAATFYTVLEMWGEKCSAGRP